MSCLLLEIQEWEVWPMYSVRGVTTFSWYKQKGQDVSAYCTAIVSAVITVPTLTRWSWAGSSAGSRMTVSPSLDTFSCPLLYHCQGWGCTGHWGGDDLLCTQARGALGRAPRPKLLGVTNVMGCYWIVLRGDHTNLHAHQQGKRKGSRFLLFSPTLGLINF